MQKFALVVLLSFLVFGCNSKPVEEKQQKPAVREEKEPDPYEANSENSEESQDPQKGYYDPLRGVKDVKKQTEEELQKEKEAIDEADNND
jgi:hypothetical protein